MILADYRHLLVLIPIQSFKLNFLHLYFNYLKLSHNTYLQIVSNISVTPRHLLQFTFPDNLLNFHEIQYNYHLVEIKLQFTRLLFYINGGRLKVLNFNLKYGCVHYNSHEN